MAVAQEGERGVASMGWARMGCKGVAGRLRLRARVEWWVLFASLVGCGLVVVMAVLAGVRGGEDGFALLSIGVCGYWMCAGVGGNSSASHRRRYRRRLRACLGDGVPRGVCPRCGYDLAGIDGRRCPECGWRLRAR